MSSIICRSWQRDKARISELIVEKDILRAKLQAAEAETARKESENQRLRGLLEDVVDNDTTPEPSCNCCISPPCDDCVEYGGWREIISTIKRHLERRNHD